MAVKRAMRHISVIRWLGVASVAGMLSGCALPPVVSVASLALDFASYGETGKTVTDHGISFVLQMDCGLLRVFDGPICTEESDETEVVLAAAVPGGEAGLDGDPVDLSRDLAYLQVTAIRPTPRHAGAEADLRIARLEFADGWNGAAGAVETVPLVPAVPVGAVETVPLVPAVPLGAVETVALMPAVPLGAVETVTLVPAGDDALGVLGYLADDAEPIGATPPWRRLSRVGYLADDMPFSTARIASAMIGG
jgi:hypothetical protein